MRFHLEVGSFAGENVATGHAFHLDRQMFQLGGNSTAN